MHAVPAVLLRCGWGRAAATPFCLGALFVLLTLGLQQWPGVAEALRFSRAVYEQGAHWQLLTAQWVHLSFWHALANALAFGLIVLLSRAWVRWPLQLLALCGGYAGVALVVALDANCSHYAGASGALHGLLAGNAAAMLWATRVPKLPVPCPISAAPQTGSSQKQESPFAPDMTGGDCRAAATDAVALHRRRLLAMAVLAILAFKLWLQAGGVPDAPGLSWDFPVYHPAHLAGTLGGFALVSLWLTAHAAMARRQAGRP